MICWKNVDGDASNQKNEFENSFISIIQVHIEMWSGGHKAVAAEQAVGKPVFQDWMCHGVVPVLSWDYW